MATATDVARNNVLREQARERATVLRREALRGAWRGVDGALGRLLALLRPPRGARTG